MDTEQIKHEARVAASVIGRDGNTQMGRDLAKSFLVMSNTSELTNAENAFAAARFIVSLLGGLTLPEQAILISAIGNIAIEIHQAHEAPTVGNA